MSRSEAKLRRWEFQHKLSQFPHLERLVNKGFSLQQARDYAADGLIRDTVLCRTYKTMALNQSGRQRLRKVTTAYRELGIEPPFAEVIDVDLLMSNEFN